MSLNKDRQIQELYGLKHRYDSKSYRHFPWEDNLMKKTTTPYMWQNETMYNYLLKIEKMTVLMLEQINFARNFFNFTVDKDYNDHWG